MDSIITLDEKVVNELKELMGQDYLTVYEAFLRSAQSNVEKLIIAVNQTDIKTVESMAHSLKGSSSNIGAKKFSHMCKNMLEDIRQDRVLELQSDMQSILEEYKNLTALIKQLFA